jgi:hypothetical protein
MTVRVYVNSVAKRTDTLTLIDSGATENFMSQDYARYARLPMKQLATPRKVFNVDGTLNRNGNITHYTDLELRTGKQRRIIRFFLTNLGEQKMILGYPWFAAVQPKIDWAKGWIDYSHLPIVLRTTDATLQIQKNLSQINHVMAPAGKRQTMASQLAEVANTQKSKELPDRYKVHAKVFSEEEAQRFPEAREWDHAIELKKDAPSTLPGKIYALSQPKREALKEFISEHLKKKYIRPSKSPYAAPFFFIKKKDGKLRPVQDYRKLNEWTIKNRYPLPLIPELIARVKDSVIFSKFDVTSEKNFEIFFWRYRQLKYVVLCRLHIFLSFM